MDGWAVEFKELLELAMSLGNASISHSLNEWT